MPIVKEYRHDLSVLVNVSQGNLDEFHFHCRAEKWDFCGTIIFFKKRLFKKYFLLQKMSLRVRNTIIMMTL